MPSSRSRSPRKPRATRTRADVTESFDELTAEDREVLDPQAAKLANEHATRTREAVKGLSVDSLVQKGAALGLEIGRTLTGLTEQCVARANELKTLEDAVALETKELERLYDLDTASASFQLLVEIHNEKKAELEKEQAELRAKWEDTRNAYDKAVKEQSISATRERQREEESYKYQRDTARAREDDAFAEKVRLQTREHADRQALFEKDVTARRTALETDEKEIAALRVRVAGLDEEIKKEADKQVAIATNSLKRDLEFKHTLAVKDHEAALNLQKQTNASLTAANTELARQNLAYSAALDAAKQQVQDIAVKALESASGQQALQQVTAIVKDSNGSAGRTGKS